ncbi:MAG: zinc ribbon domain-containing protein [Treponemataceae bacterium]|nr:zinc ribbon domain-containing protein [Treponemataceae bacterium]
MICSNCGSEVQDGMKFCGECGTPVPQTKKCINCGLELPLNMKFCGECGAKQDESAPKSSGFSMGDKNVIAGDVIGSKEETNISGNATIIKNEDQTKQVKKCHICGSFVSIVDGYNCPECGEFTCEDCFDSKYRVCNSCVSLALKKNEEKYKDALEKALEDGTISITERKELKELQTKYGITDQKAKQLEEIVKFGQPQTETNFTTMEKINFEKATELFYEDGKVEKAYKLLEPIYKAHPYEEKVLNIYLPVLVKKDIEAAKKIAKELNVDMLSIYLASIDIAFEENNLNEAERIIHKGKQIWKDNSILQSYEAILYIKFAQTTKDKSFLKTAEEITNNFPKSMDKLELSYQMKTILELQKEKGEDTSYFTEEFCKENNLYTSLFDFKVIIIKVGKNQEIKTLKEAIQNVIYIITKLKIIKLLLIF